MFGQKNLKKIDWEETIESHLLKTKWRASAPSARTLWCRRLLWHSSHRRQPNTWNRWHNWAKYTEERFGKTISMFIPLYITNSCTNSCVYYGFRPSAIRWHVPSPHPPTDGRWIQKTIKELGPVWKPAAGDRRESLQGRHFPIWQKRWTSQKYFSNLKIRWCPSKPRIRRAEKHGLNGVICFQNRV